MKMLTGRPQPTLRMILDELPAGWIVAITDLPDGFMGYTDFDERAVWLSRALDDDEMRCTLVHELIHVERGDTHDDPAIEALVRLETARKLIPTEKLAAALAVTTDPADICAALGVDRGVLRTRLRNLTDDERRVMPTCAAIWSTIAP